jgi:hypothetical protein
MDKKNFKTIKLDLTDSEFLFIARQAHKKDITINQMMVEILEDGLKKIEKLGIDYIKDTKVTKKTKKL